MIHNTYRHAYTHAYIISARVNKHTPPPPPHAHTHFHMCTLAPLTQGLPVVGITRGVDWRSGRILQEKFQTHERGEGNNGTGPVSGSHGSCCSQSVVEGGCWCALEPFQRQCWGNVQETGWSVFGLFPAHKYHRELNCWCKWLCPITRKSELLKVTAGVNGYVS